MSQNFKDETINCIGTREKPNCGTAFLFTAKDQQFYAEKGFDKPKRCKPCREDVKLARANSGR